MPYTHTQVHRVDSRIFLDLLAAHIHLQGVPDPNVVVHLDAAAAIRAEAAMVRDALDLLLEYERADAKVRDADAGVVQQLGTVDSQSERLEHGAHSTNHATNSLCIDCAPLRIFRD